MVPIKIAIVDDHLLFAKSLSTCMDSFNTGNENRYFVSLIALNGADLIEQLGKVPRQHIPDIILLDLNMPVMNGFDTLSWLGTNFPLIKVVMLTMKSDDTSIIRCLRLGACGYLLKDIHPNELKNALDSFQEKGYYNADSVTIAVMRHFGSKGGQAAIEERATPAISERERQFLKLACSDLTYKDIAVEMSVSERTVDGYRDSLFSKLKVQSRVGLALEAIRRSLIEL
jgi:DNA-binding NarL/FixJ family response regulator